MIETAEVIAVVEITSVETVSVKGEYWTYRQKATGKTEKVLKGKVSSNFSMFGEEDFICARCRFGVGRYWCFLSEMASY